MKWELISQLGLEFITQLNHSKFITAEEDERIQQAAED
jgi:hypothetical protein